MLRRASVAAFLTAAVAFASAQTKLAYEKYTLPNGMTVILREDHSLPVAAVSIWYKVGSKDEPARRSGFAHLFEHLMFMGTKRVPNGSFDTIMEGAGGSNNASTGEDRTEYHESGPSNLLPTLLWLEADRLQTLGRDIDQSKLDLQRDVVKNERRQNTENTPYGSAFEAINGIMWPANHPYGHSVIGSMTDLDNASVADVQQFFATYYVPNNAVMAVVGDFKTADVKRQIASLFGTLPRKDDPPRIVLPDYDFKTKRVTMTDRVPQSLVLMAWHSPARFAKGDAALDLIGSALGDGVSSRLYKRLVTDDKLATEVSASQDSRLLGSLFEVVVSAAPGADLDKIEAAVDDEIGKMKKEGPTSAELERARTAKEVQIAGATQSVLSLAGDLTEYDAYLGTPDGFTRELADLRAVTPAEARDQARETLNPDKRLILRVIPQTAPATSAQDPRDVQPAIGPASAFTAPTPVDFTLKNGLKVHYFRREGVPLVSMLLLGHRGAAEEPIAKAGETSLMASLLDAGAGARNAVQFSDSLDLLGASFSAGASARTTTAGMTVLERNLDKALPLFLDAVGKPRFNADELDRAKRQRLASAPARRRTTPGQLARKVAREAYFGADSPLGRPVSGTAASVASIDEGGRRSRLQADARPRRLRALRRRSGFRAGRDAGGARQGPRLLERAGRPPSPPAPLPPVTPKPLRVLIVERPGAVQTNVRFLFPAPPLGDANRSRRRVGRRSRSAARSPARLNQNLREAKGYTYGASFGLRRPARAWATVQRRRRRPGRRDRPLAPGVPEGVRPPARRRRDGGGGREVGPAPTRRGGRVARHPRRPARAGDVLRHERPDPRPARRADLAALSAKLERGRASTRRGKLSPLRATRASSSSSATSADDREGPR